GVDCDNVSHFLPNVTVVQDQEDADWDSPFLKLRASLPSYSQPIRPYSLQTRAEDYFYLPKPRHRRPSRLLRLLGSSFDPFWMSIDQPSEASEGSRPLQHGLLKHTTFKEKFNLSSSSELRDAAVNSRQKLSVRSWLVRSATCELHYRWVDLGPAFWPRWLRQTDCERADGERSCSFPSGMKCVRAQTAHIRILAWHCTEIRDGSGGIKGNRCLWRQMPYPVVTACLCSCK
uniref:Noggin n=1 Tax=Acanthochromis polyacanthus TaxID=80966 RepID=A0A3Q1EUH4_9TELE